MNMKLSILLTLTILVTGCLENTPPSSSGAAQQLASGLDFSNGNFVAPAPAPTPTPTPTNIDTNSSSTNSETTVTFL